MDYLKTISQPFNIFKRPRQLMNYVKPGRAIIDIQKYQVKLINFMEIKIIDKNRFIKQISLDPSKIWLYDFQSLIFPITCYISITFSKILEDQTRELVEISLDYSKKYNNQSELKSFL